MVAMANLTFSIQIIDACREKMVSVSWLCLLFGDPQDTICSILLRFFCAPDGIFLCPRATTRGKLFFKPSPPNSFLNRP